MTERPILFSGAMVRAILQNKKQQTRRVVKPQPPAIAGLYYRHCGHGLFAGYMPPGERADIPEARCPYGAPGSQLWVRETWAVDAPLEQVRAEREDAMRVEPIFGHGPYFRADGIHENTGLTWRPSIHMPRWARRLVLEVTGVRVERLQDISEADAKAEGLLAAEGDGLGPGPGYKWHGTGYHGAGYTERGEPTFHTPSESRCGCKVAGPTPAQCAYRELWDSLNARRGFSFESNPYVWVLSFRRAA